MGGLSMIQAEPAGSGASAANPWHDWGMQSEPELCHEASGVLGVCKPSGLPTQAPTGIASVESWLRERFPAGHYLGVPHRLDRAVSGIMLFAATPRAARQLSRQFARRQIGKTYLALAVPSSTATDVIESLRQAGADGLIWNDTLEKIPDQPRARIVEPGTQGAAEATTRVRLLAEGIGEHRAVLLQMEPETGRMHQLRVQASARALPILGDTLYGGPADRTDPEGDARAAPIALHAWRIRFADPDTKQGLELESPPPPTWPDIGRWIGDGSATSA